MMQIREGIGWFTLELYTSSENTAQTTDIDIELSDSVRIEISNTEYCDTCINDYHKDINITESSIYKEDIELNETIQLDIGKVEKMDK